MAEGVGFEPTEVLPSTVFGTVAFVRSANPLKSGASDGNRTRVRSLEGSCSTVEPRSHGRGAPELHQLRTAYETALDTDPPPATFKQCRRNPNRPTLRAPRSSNRCDIFAPSRFSRCGHYARSRRLTVSFHGVSALSQTRIPYFFSPLDTVPVARPMPAWRACRGWPLSVGPQA